MATIILYGDEARMLPWAAERIGIASFAPDAKTIGIERDGRIAGVVVYDRFAGVDLNMHVASDGSRNWLTRAFLLHVAAYPFIQLKAWRVTAQVYAGNQDARRFLAHAGFRLEGYHPDACERGAMVTMGLLRRNCTYLPEQYRT